MRVVVLTSALRGFASLCLPLLIREPQIEVAMVVYSEGKVLNPKRHRERKSAKARKIGLLGALNGIRMRRWFREDVTEHLNIEDLESLANRLNVRFEKTPTINCQRTVDLFNAADADLGLSLGNSYIGGKVFESPKYGMINVHHELLPEFRGAQSVIWQIYEGSRETGYTIHQIDNHTDTGKILYQEKVTMELQPTLRKTVSHNYGRLYEVSAMGLVKLVKGYFDFHAAAKSQVAHGRAFTTPTLWQYLKMTRQHRKLYNNQLRDPRLLPSSNPQ
jgi:methionyl-tRNA formyltransferase